MHTTNPPFAKTGDKFNKALAKLYLPTDSQLSGFYKAAVNAALLHKLLMRAALGDFAALNDKNVVRIYIIAFGRDVTAATPSSVKYCSLYVSSNTKLYAFIIRVLLSFPLKTVLDVLLPSHHVQVR